MRKRNHSVGQAQTDFPRTVGLRRSTEYSFLTPVLPDLADDVFELQQQGQ